MSSTGGRVYTLVKNHLYLFERATAVTHPMSTVVDVKPLPEALWCLGPPDRAMWGIPKDIAEFGFTRGPVFTGSAEASERRIAQAAFAPLLRPLPTPARGSILQTLDGELAQTPIRVRGLVRPARAGWRFEQDGPLAWLHGRPAIASLTTTGFRMRFGPRA